MLDHKFIDNNCLAIWVGIKCIVGTQLASYVVSNMQLLVTSYMAAHEHTSVTIILQPFIQLCHIKLSNLIISSLYISFRFVK